MSTHKSISGIIGKGIIRHNNRDFYAANVNQERTKNNIILCKQDIHKVYHELFDEALSEYNDKQKRKDRRIPDYYEHIRTSKQEKLFYEVIFQIGEKIIQLEKLIEKLFEFLDKFKLRDKWEQFLAESKKRDRRIER